MYKVSEIRQKYYLLGQQAALLKLAEQPKQPKEKVPSSNHSLLQQGIDASKKVKIRGYGLSEGAKKLVNTFEPAYIANSLTTNKGRKKLLKEYSPLAPEKDSPRNMARDLVTMVTSGPTSPSTYAAGGRTLHRSLRGAKKRESERIQHARKGNTDMVQLMSDQDPRFMM